MKIAVSATDELFNELTANTADVEWIKVNNWASCVADNKIDAYFNLLDQTLSANYLTFDKPIFINAVINTLKELNAPANACRIAAWPGFLKRDTWEITHASDKHLEVLNRINKKFIYVQDEIGMPSAKIISMIINEAYFALEENVSTKEEVDIAMKQGTNYPYGPFEWSKKIGLKNIYTLLQKLSLADKRYTPSSLLIKEATASSDYSTGEI